MHPGMAYSPQTELAQPISDQATEIEVVNIAALPPAPAYAVIGIDDHGETILYRGIVGNTLTQVLRNIERPDEARAWTANSIISCNITEARLRTIQENIQLLDTALVPHNHAAPTAEFGQGTTTNFGHVQTANANPLADGAVAIGTDNGRVARADHRHPANVDTVVPAALAAAAAAGTSTIYARRDHIHIFPTAANVGAAPANATLTNEAASNALPAVVSTPLTALLQTTRNCLRWLTERFNASGHATRAVTADTLTTARTIGGVSFNGSANINLPGVNAAGTQNTTGNAASATVLQTARTIGGVSFNGSAAINLPGVNAAGNQNTTGNAATATRLQNARTINGVSFDGSANISLTAAQVGAQPALTGVSSVEFGQNVATVTGTGSVSTYIDFHTRRSGSTIRDHDARIIAQLPSGAANPTATNQANMSITAAQLTIPAPAAAANDTRAATTAWVRSTAEPLRVTASAAEVAARTGTTVRSWTPSLVAQAGTNVWYGSNTTAAGTAAKVVALTGGQPPFPSIPPAGTLLIVATNTGNTAASPTLTVAPSAVAPIVHGVIGAITWGMNTTLVFVRLAGTWQIIVGGYVSTTATGSRGSGASLTLTRVGDIVYARIDTGRFTPTSAGNVSWQLPAGFRPLAPAAASYVGVFAPLGTPLPSADAAGVNMATDTGLYFVTATEIRSPYRAVVSGSMSLRASWVVAQS
jgi:hypothetical protein